MTKILIEVFCPMMGKVYDFRVSVNMTVEKLLETIIKDIAFLSTDTTLTNYSADIVLFSGCGALPRDKTLAELSIKGGDRLLLL